MASNMVVLGDLEKLPREKLREVWPDEAANFTPWLAEPHNLALLGRALGLELELDSVEKPVGPFAADILAKDSVSQRRVVVENQIAPTDHTHLGQLLTYAAGLGARAVVWIAESFRDQHRAAIDFLNSATTEDFDFFAVEIELYRIGESQIAPRFSVVARPNIAVKESTAALGGALSESQKAYLEYWSGLIKMASGRYPALSERTPGKNSWQYFETLRGGDPKLSVNASFPWDKGLRLEVYIDGKLAKAAFNVLRKDKKDPIQSALGKQLSWEELPDAKASRIALYMPPCNIKRENRDQWPQQHEWLLTWGPKLAEVIRPFAKQLDATNLQQLEQAELSVGSDSPQVT